jgi:glycosyltransferase involved in cell wall biosynthesis
MIAAVTMVRNEEDIIGEVVRHLLDEGIDLVIVADNLSDDFTRPILDELAEQDSRVLIVDDLEPAYDQAGKMTRLVHKAGAMGADWILPFDADEWWYWAGGTLAEFFAECSVDVLTATGWDHIATLDDDPSDPNPISRITWRRQSPQKMGKVAFRYHPDAELDTGNHNVFRHPGTRGKALRYRHYQYRTLEQMISKVRTGAKAADEAALHPMYATHWRNLAALTDEELVTHWQKLCSETGLIEDPVL